MTGRFFPRILSDKIRSAIMGRNYSIQMHYKGKKLASIKFSIDLDKVLFVNYANYVNYS
jgi:hypothetical protein